MKQVYLNSFDDLVYGVEMLQNKHVRKCCSPGIRISVRRCKDRQKRDMLCAYVTYRFFLVKMS